MSPVFKHIHVCTYVNSIIHNRVFSTLLRGVGFLNMKGISLLK